MLWGKIRKICIKWTDPQVIDVVKINPIPILQGIELGNKFPAQSYYPLKWFKSLPSQLKAE
jgi:hypothetical protein